MKKFIFLFCLLISKVSLAQPANDLCSGAVTIPQNGTCISGTTTASGDHWAGTIGCAGNNEEVWYSFTATGTQATLVTTNGTQTGNVEIILVSASSACSGLVLEGSSCGASPLTSTFVSLVPGTLYYYTISSTGANGTFTACNTVSTPPPVSGQDCTTAAILCDNASFGQAASTAGSGSVSGNASSENLSALGCLLADERQSKWYKFTVGCTGTIQFIITPVTPANDYDWAIYDITSSGCILTPGGLAAGGASQRTCSFSACPGATGVSSVANACTTFGAADCEGMPGCQANGIVTTIPTLTAGNTYALVIDNFSTSNSGFNFAWTGGTAVIGPSANYTFTQSPDCFTITPTKTCATSNSTYLWSFGDGTSSTLQSPGPHLYTIPGNYNVSLTTTDAIGCSNTFSQVINVGCIPLPVELGSFSGVRAERSTQLKWRLESETNNDFFTLERSTDGEVWNTVNTQKSAGNHTSGKDYGYQDDISSISQNQTIYYKLWQTDLNGNRTMLGITTHSGIAGNSENINLIVSPNPSQNSDAQLNIISKYEENGVLIIYDAFGKIIDSKEIDVNKGYNSYPIESANWQKGVYIIEFTTSSDRSSTRMMKM